MFLRATKEDKHQSLGYPNSAYGMSKVSLTAATFVQQRVLDSDKTRPDIVVNACCPGIVKIRFFKFYPKIFFLCFRLCFN